MPGDRTSILVETTRRLLRRGATANLRKMINKTHAADISALFRHLSASHQSFLFAMIESPQTRGLILSELDENAMKRIAEQMPISEMVEALHDLPNDDVADIIGRLPAEQAEAILQAMNDEESQEVEGLLGYDDETAGGIMTPEFVAVRQEATAQESIESLRKEHLDVEMPFYLYVVDENGRLVGVSSLRQLVLEAPGRPIKEFMNTDIVSVRTDMDQEEVARLVARYDILAVPVVDSDNVLKGIVTVDDVIDIIREEATEDIFKMAGVGDEFVENQTVMRSARIRLPWLFASWIGGMMAALVVGGFAETLEKVAYLAAFMPVIAGMGGNVGTQSSTIVVRGLAMGRIHLADLWKVVGKQLAVGLILGAFYGLLVGAVAKVSFGQANMAIAVALGMLASMSIASLMGSLFPLVFTRLHIDPAVATGPFVTTATDVVSVFFYFSIATALLGL